MKSSQIHGRSFLVLWMIYIPVLASGQDFSTLLKSHKENLVTERVFLNTDRFVYTADEVIWVQGMVLGMYSNTLSSESEELTIEVNGTAGTTYMVHKLPVVDGLVSGAMVLTQGMPAGALFINAYTEHSPRDNPYARMVICNDVVVPDFRIQLAFPDKVYFPGDAIAARIAFTDHFNEPLNRIDYTVTISDGKRDLQKWEGRTAKDGSVDLSYKIPGGYEESSILISVEATGKSGTGSVTGLVPVCSEKYFAFVFPEGGNLLAGQLSQVTVLILDAFGRPFGDQAMIADSEEQVIQQAPVDAAGFTSFRFRPTAGHQYHFRLLKPFLSERRIDLPDVQAAGYNLVHKGSVDNDIVLEIQNTTGIERAFLLVGLEDGNLAYRQSGSIAGTEIIRIDKGMFEGEYVTFGLLSEPGNLLLAQHTVLIDRSEKAGCALSGHAADTEIREQVKFALNCASTDIAGHCFTAVYEPWIERHGFNPDLTAIAGPVEYYGQLSMIADPLISESGYRADVAAALTPAYMSFSSIVGLEQAAAWWLTPELRQGRAFLSSVQAFNNHRAADGMSYFDNNNASAYFLASNPDLLQAFKRTPAERKPAYKTLLESGTELPKVIYTIKPYQLEGNKIVFYGSRNSLLFQQGALIVVDGIQLGEDASVLNNISPFDVDEIRISTNPMDIQRYTGLNSVGLIEITTKRGGSDEDASNRPDAPPEEFDSPDYGHHPARNRGSDVRRTLFWQCGKGSLSDISPVSYYNSDLRGPVHVLWSVLLKNGNVDVCKSQYTVK